MTTYSNTEVLVVEWLKSCDEIAIPLTRPDGGISIFTSMPKVATLPSIVLSRVGGAPDRGSDVPSDVARISFNCWATSRTFTQETSLTLVGLLEDLAPTGGYKSGASHLVVAETLSWIWSPDPESDIPRYVVDALVTAITD